MLVCRRMTRGCVTPIVIAALVSCVASIVVKTAGVASSMRIPARPASTTVANGRHLRGPAPNAETMRLNVSRANAPAPVRAIIVRAAGRLGIVGQRGAIGTKAAASPTAWLRRTRRNRFAAIDLARHCVTCRRRAGFGCPAPLTPEGATPRAAAEPTSDVRLNSWVRDVGPVTSKPATSKPVTSSDGLCPLTGVPTSRGAAAPCR